MTNKKRSNILFNNNSLTNKEGLAIMINLKNVHIENLDELRLKQLELEKEMFEIDCAMRLVRDNMQTLDHNLEHFAE